MVNLSQLLVLVLLSPARGLARAGASLILRFMGVRMLDYDIFALGNVAVIVTDGCRMWLLTPVAGQRVDLAGDFLPLSSDAWAIREYPFIERLFLRSDCFHLARLRYGCLVWTNWPNLVGDVARRYLADVWRLAR